MWSGHNITIDLENNSLQQKMVDIALTSYLEESYLALSEIRKFTDSDVKSRYSQVLNFVCPDVYIFITMHVLGEQYWFLC